MLTKLTANSLCNIYVYQIFTLYTENEYNVIRQLYLNLEKRNKAMMSTLVALSLYTSMIGKYSRK